jgi:hypothetical protein
MFYPQGNFSTLPSLIHPQSVFGQQGLHGGYPGTTSGIPFANTLYGYPQLTPNLSTPNFSPQLSNWQHPAQLAALQQQALQQFLAPQFSSQPFSQPFMPQHTPGTNALNGLNGLNGLANGAQSAGVWQQPQASPEQISPALLQQSQQHFLQRLAQYHYSLAQQLTQMAAQQIAQSTGNPFGNPYASPFIPSQLGANFVPGITMH